MARSSSRIATDSSPMSEPSVGETVRFGAVWTQPFRVSTFSLPVNNWLKPHQTTPSRTH
jgi:hypothetical protein